MKAKKALTLALSSSLLFGVFVSPAAASQAETYQPDQTQHTLTTSNNELDKAIKAEKVSQKELTRYSIYVKTQVKETGEVTPEWKLAAVKKAVKFMVDHADTIPIKAVRDAVKKYGPKINNAMDTLETYSWWGIANALTKAGVPDKYADMIADFIVKYIL
ncbi:hypothetical protein ACP2W0_17885 [Pseudobacillus badius]|uniref:hypothetical protein n=1 Tax=Bacillus badius TaxID=1455 RepID=UPI0007B04D94|nr:hypothetical protein [Bacillus badius]KZN99174.1 hypothetical protein A4244_08795 [Bacillus badius]OCS84109.1 hypothetical protein A6M11_08805 [Bacillus badius]OVE52598.1 hypothetical protein B1A98_03030 [Bacillus badius]TDW04593.1 hypothetical protein B0G66_10216 [Bacillus badius]